MSGKEPERTFSPSTSLSRKSVRGFTYWERLVMPFVSKEWMPEPVKSTAVTLKPPSSRSAIVLYQHQAPKPPPWTRTKWLVSRSSSLISCSNEKMLGKEINNESDFKGMEKTIYLLIQYILSPLFIRSHCIIVVSRGNIIN